MLQRGAGHGSQSDVSKTRYSYLLDVGVDRRVDMRPSPAIVAICPFTIYDLHFAAPRRISTAGNRQLFIVMSLDVERGLTTRVNVNVVDLVVELHRPPSTTLGTLP